MASAARKTVRFNASDIPVIRHACAILTKLLIKAKRDAKRLSLPTASIESYLTQAAEIDRITNRALGTEGQLPQETFSLDYHLTACLKVGNFLYLDELEKLKGQQVKLDLESTDDVDTRIRTVTKLNDRLSDQLSLIGPGGVNEVRFKVERAQPEKPTGKDAAAGEKPEALDDDEE